MIDTNKLPDVVPQLIRASLAHKCSLLVVAIHGWILGLDSVEMLPELEMRNGVIPLHAIPWLLSSVSPGRLHAETTYVSYTWLVQIKNIPATAEPSPVVSQHGDF